MKTPFLVIFLCILTSCKSKQDLLDPLQAGWEGEKVCELLEENKKLRVLKCTFAPGIGHERHFHAEHFGYTLSGSRFRITDTSGTREIQVPSGSEFYSNGTEWHEVLNIGDSTGVFLIIEPKN